MLSISSVMLQVRLDAIMRPYPHFKHIYFLTKADAAAGATKLDAAAKTAVKNGLPYIGYSYSAASSSAFAASPFFSTRRTEKTDSS